MRKEERLAVILQKLREDGYVKSNELSKLFNISEMTIWRDLDELEKLGCLKKVFGGAVDIKGTYDESPINERVFENTSAKENIAAYAISLLKTNDRVFLDSGSTCYIIARNLVNIDKRLFCSTNALNTAVELSKNNEIKTIVIGGELKGKSMCCIGPSAEAQIKAYSFSVSFVACNGIDIDGNVMLLDLGERGFKRDIIETSDKCYLVCDSLKIGKTSMVSLTDVSKFTGIITDKGLDPKIKKTLEGKGARFILA